MTVNTARSQRARVGWAWAALAIVLMGLLPGCASQSGGSGDSISADMTTPSEEPESRKRARIRLELASNYFAEGKTEVALDELRQVLAADPSLADAYVLRGLIYMRLNEMRQAEESFRRAVSLNPNDSNAHHNYGWLQCQQGRYQESFRSFNQALANPLYGERPKTLMTLGLCQARAGMKAEAEKNLSRSLELDAGNPVTGYNLSQLLYQGGEYKRAQFYVRRINNSELANAESLWLGIKVERRMNDLVAMRQLGDQLRKRFPQSPQRLSYERGAFNE